MAKARQCDRCGEFYQEYGAKFVQDIVDQYMKDTSAVEESGERNVF